MRGKPFIFSFLLKVRALLAEEVRTTPCLLSIPLAE